jgi:hypothetical protein
MSEVRCCRAFKLNADTVAVTAISMLPTGNACMPSLMVESNKLLHSAMTINEQVR